MVQVASVFAISKYNKAVPLVLAKFYFTVFNRKLVKIKTLSCRNKNLQNFRFFFRILTCKKTLQFFQTF